MHGCSAASNLVQTSSKDSFRNVLLFPLNRRSLFFLRLSHLLTLISKVAVDLLAAVEVANIPLSAGVLRASSNFNLENVTAAVATVIGGFVDAVCGGLALFSQSLSW